MFDKLLQQAKQANDVVSLKRVLVGTLEEIQKKAAAPKPKAAAKKSKPEQWID